MKLRRTAQALAVAVTAVVAIGATGPAHADTGWGKINTIQTSKGGPTTDDTGWGIR